MDKAKYTNFVLHSYWRASCAWRVRIAMNLKNIPYKINAVNVLKSEQKSDEYSKVNVFGKIPCLEFDQIVDNQTKKIFLSESTAIIDFLEEAFPEPTLYPKDLVSKAEVKRIAMHIACNIHPIQNLPVIKMVEGFGREISEWPRHWITEGLKTLEAYLATTRGKYCFGDSITIADVYLVPQLLNAYRFKVEMENFKNILEISKNLSEVKAFIDAEPDNQPDAVKQ